MNMVMFDEIITASYGDVLKTVAIASGCVALFAFIKAYRHVREFRGFFKDSGIVQLPYNGWTGGWTLYMQQKEDLFQLELDLIKKYGKVFAFFEGRYPCIMVADAEIAKAVMIRDHENFMNRRPVFPLSRDRPLDLQVVGLSGAHWKHVRQQLTPAFTPGHLRRMEPLILKTADQLVAHVGRLADGKISFNAKDTASSFTLGVIASVAFAIDVDAFTNPNDDFFVMARKIFQLTMQKINDGPFASMLMFPDLIPKIVELIPAFAATVKMFDYFVNIVEAEMKRRRSTEGELVNKRQDFLGQVMYLEKDPRDPANKPYLEYDEFNRAWVRNGLTRNEITGQSVIFMLAGYETTATALTMALMALSQNPEVQEKLYQELKATFGDGQREVTTETVNDVKYVEMVVNETLRMYSPVLRTDRICNEETTISGVKFSKGVIVVLPFNAILHDPDYWPEPEKFIPERFSDENADNIVSNSFVPFGAGNRNCIGMRLAVIELKLALARLILSFKFSLSPETELPVRWMPSLLRIPMTKILLTAERRS